MAATGNSKTTTIKKPQGFQPGKSGNPSGRPKIPVDIKDAFKLLTPKAIERLKEIVEDKDADRNVLIKAINTVLDRAYGRPIQQTELSGPDGGPISINFEGKLEEWSR